MIQVRYNDIPANQDDSSCLCSLLVTLGIGGGIGGNVVIEKLVFLLFLAPSVGYESVSPKMTLTNKNNSQPRLVN